MELLSSEEKSTTRDSDIKDKKEMNTASNKKILEEKENQVKSKEVSIVLNLLVSFGISQETDHRASK